MKTFLLAVAIFFGVILTVALCREFPAFLPGCIVLGLLSRGAAVSFKKDK